MRRMAKLSIVVTLCIVLAGCGQTVNHNGKTPLVGIGQDFLYKEDLEAVIPVSLRGEDSIAFAQKYIRNWVEETLLFRKAEGNIPNSRKIDELVASYRKALIMHTYQEELVNQKLGTEITEEEIEQYYAQNAGMFRADQPYVQGVFVKVPVNTPQLNRVRTWYKSNSNDAIDKLEKFSIGHAIHYDYFYDTWKPVADLSVKLPLKQLDTDLKYLDSHRNIELKDSAFCYFLHVENFLPQGEQLPLEYAKNEIKEILINLKRVEFINRMKDDLYQDASENEDIIYY